MGGLSQGPTLGVRTLEDKRDGFAYEFFKGPDDVVRQSIHEWINEQMDLAIEQRPTDMEGSEIVICFAHNIRIVLDKQGPNSFKIAECGSDIRLVDGNRPRMERVQFRVFMTKKEVLRAK